MQGYRTIRTNKTSYKFIKKGKLLDKAFNFTVAVLATYGFLEFILQSNGL